MESCSKLLTMFLFMFIQGLGHTCWKNNKSQKPLKFPPLASTCSSQPAAWTLGRTLQHPTRGCWGRNNVQQVQPVHWSIIIFWDTGDIWTLTLPHQDLLVPQTLGSRSFDPSLGPLIQLEDLSWWLTASWCPVCWTVVEVTQMTDTT